MILLDLNSADDRPIYGQIADRVKFAVAGGVLRPGDLVPSVRELSKQLVVNPNTVARAYRDLQTEGLLESVRGMGLQVAEGARGSLPGGAAGDGAAAAAASDRRGAAEQDGPGRDRGDPPRGVGSGERSRQRRRPVARHGGRSVENGFENHRRSEGRRGMIEAQARIGAVIQVEGLTKRYGSQKAVDGLSLTVPEGSVFGLLGENGAGKTTTIQTLLGLIKPDAGRTRGAGARPGAARARGAPADRLRARVAGALRLDDRRRDRLVRRGVPPRLRRERPPATSTATPS